MLEKDLQRTVIAMARALGWKVAHFRTAQTQAGNYVTPVQADGAGFPDLVLVRDGRLMFVELKAKGGRLSDRQQHWIELLRTVSGIEVAVWSPEDLDTGYIESRLR